MNTEENSFSNSEYEKRLHSLCFENIIDFSQQQNHANQAVTDEVPVFSFMMCVYNDTSLLNIALNSLLKQNFRSWELVILDNSDKNDHAWEMIQNAVLADPRVRAYKSDQNKGWARGASICLQHVRGKYVTFLSADDFINFDALEKLNHVVETENPDVIFVGNGYVTYDDENKQFQLIKQLIPSYKVYGKNNRSDAIIEIMQHLYCNSMFHYEKVSFLKENNIDFYEPYYGDNGSMFRTMAVADKICTLNYLVYYLTLNTSQTRGYYIWDSYEFISVNCWINLYGVIKRENYNNQNGIVYVAARIMRILCGMIGQLCRGRVRDKDMNSMDVSFQDIIQQLEKIMTNQYIIEMLRLAENTVVFHDLLKGIQNLNVIYSEDKRKIIEKSWLTELIELALHYDDSSLSVEKRLEYISCFILREENTSSIGIDYFAETIDQCSDAVLLKLKTPIQMVLDKCK